MTTPRLDYGTPGPQKEKPPQLNGCLALLTGLILFGGCVMSCGGLLLYGDSPSPANMTFLITCLSLPVSGAIALGLGTFFEKKREHRKAQLACLLPVLALLVFLTVNGLWGKLHLIDNIVFIFS